MVTLHVSVWVEINGSTRPYGRSKSRSTWACELKFWYAYLSRIQTGHAPRERVSWNVSRKCCQIIINVTLHVSVWVEIMMKQTGKKKQKSRSTWACELKWRTSKNNPKCLRHAPRERVSWNPTLLYEPIPHNVTLHVSVWVEILIAVWDSVMSLVTLHVSVWVEINKCLKKHKKM